MADAVPVFALLPEYRLVSADRLLERVVLRFDREESPQQKLGKLEGFLVQYGLPLAEAVPLFAALLSLPLTADYAPLTVSPEQQKQKTLHALLTILLRIAAQQSVLFVMEDLHWVDPSTLELLSLLVDQGPTARILALFTFRPDFSPPWTGRSHLTQVTLNRLPRRQAAEHDRPGGARQGPATRGRRAGRGQDRWGAAVCGGVDQDGAGVRPAPGAGRAL